MYSHGKYAHSDGCDHHANENTLEYDQKTKKRHNFKNLKVLIPKHNKILEA